MGLEYAADGTLAAALVRTGQIPTSAELDAQYGPHLRLAGALLGVVPNVARLFAVYPPAMWQYVSLVPPMLDPAGLLNPGNKLRPLVPLCMMAASLGARCDYCTAHSCGVAGLHGASVDTLVKTMRSMACPGNRPAEPLVVPGLHPDAVWAAVDATHALGRLPSTLTAGQRAAMEAHFTDREIRTLIRSAVMMGWLNQMCDSLGAPLEEPMVRYGESTIGREGWTPGRHTPGQRDRTPPPAVREDKWWTRLTLAPSVLRATRTSGRWMRPVPRKPGPLHEYFTETTGTDWPGLPWLPSAAQRALAAGMRDQLGADPRHQPVLNRATLYAVGVAYARRARDAGLLDALDRMGYAGHLSIRPGQHRLEHEEKDLDDTGQAAVSLAVAAAPNPAELASYQIDAAMRGLHPDQVVAVLHWMAMLALLARAGAWKRAGR